MPICQADKIDHFKKPANTPFLDSQKKDTTLLIGGLTEAHEELLLGHFRRFGHSVERLPGEDFESYQVGKAFSNRGQCNPTYYTTGNLIKFLQNKARASTVGEVQKKYAYFTAGACGPCRFGMYESQYRQALNDAGFDAFRLFVMQQVSGLNQLVKVAEIDEATNTVKIKDEAPGVTVDRAFITSFIGAIMAGDCLNQMVYKVRPYEIENGATLKAKHKAMAVVRKAIEGHQSVERALRQCKDIFGAVACDFTRIKPMVKVTGEFWASITEGHGNYRVKDWLVEEGAEVTQEPLLGWIEHLIFVQEIMARDRRGIKQEKRGLGGNVDPFLQEIKLAAFRVALNLWYQYYRRALDFKPNNTISNRLLSEYADDYYNKRLRGGEGYMEVGNLINCAKNKKAHMMVSVKPFGCMPSTASDSVQARVVVDYPETVFCAVETSGDSEVNFRSRVQMKLFEAKQKAAEEAAQVIKAHKLDGDRIRAFVDQHPQYKKGSFAFKNRKTGTGVSFLLEMARRMRA